MLTHKDIQQVVEKVLKQINVESEDSICNNDNGVADLSAIDLKKHILVPDPHNGQGLLDLMSTTPARIGVWRAGPRPLTETSLRFRTDHAIAMDAVFTYVSDEFLEKANLFSVSTMCADKDEFLTRPDLGRKFSPETIDLIKDKCIPRPQVQIYVSDGLSSIAIETNANDTLSAMLQGLKLHGIKTGTPFFVKHGRVPAMDVISETLQAEVTVVLIGERPGLATGESMSCYMAYNATVGMSESNRTVISNIHKQGIPAVEAGAQIADMIQKMLAQKASGLGLEV